MRVAAPEHRQRDLDLLAEALLVGAPDVAHHGLLVGADRALRQGGDLVRELTMPAQRLALVDDLVGEPDRQRLLGDDRAVR